MSKCPKCGCVFTIKRRTLAQNDGYWVAIITPLANHLGLTPMECHEIMKYKHNSEIFYVPKSNVFVEECRKIKSTTTMTTIETGEYWDRIIQWAAELEPPCILQKPGEEIKG